MSFVNFSNHPSCHWCCKQISAAEKWGAIKDVQFPNLNPEATREEILELAQKCVEDIMKHHPLAVMCQGEFTLAYMVIDLLKAQGITVVAACSQRVTTETYVNEKETRKSTIFEFVQFREY